MSVRQFDGVADCIVFDNGDVHVVNFDSATTLLVLVKPTSVGGDNECYITCQRAAPGTPSRATLYNEASGELYWGSSDPDADVGVDVSMSAGAWQILALTKASGTATPRMHRKVLGSGSWTHSNASGSVTNASGSDDSEAVIVGRFTSGTGFRDMRLAVAAVWDDVALSDGQLETLETTATTAGILALAPEWLADFNQQSTATPVDDLTGLGGDQTSIVGTTVVEGDDPTGWTFLLGAAVETGPNDPPVGISGRGAGW